MRNLAKFLIILLMMGTTNVIGEPTKKCLPNDPCWPKPDVWEALNKQVGGRLIKVESFLEPCNKVPKSDACKTALKNAEDPFYLETRPDAMQTTGYWKAWKTTPSVYAIAAETPEDILAGVNFTRKHKIKLVIKGAGHDYLGRSNASDSLLIWTHKMRDIQVVDRFIPKGCPKSHEAVPAVTVGAGARWLEVYDAVTNIGGRYVQGGGCTSVGAAGGFMMGGGFGSYSKMYGTGAANILEAEVVTADGRILVANACQNQDLFWALRGGGGGTFGVVTKMTMRTHDLPEQFGSVKGTIKAKSDKAFQALIEKFIHFFRDNLNNKHWGENVLFTKNNELKLSVFIAGLTQKEAEETWKPFTDWVSQNIKQYEIEFRLKTFPAIKKWNAEYQSGAIKYGPDNLWWWDGDSKGVSWYLNSIKSRWIPSKLIQPNGAQKLASAFFEASRHADLLLFLSKGQDGASDSAVKLGKETSSNPKLFDSPMLLILASYQEFSFPGLQGHKPNYSLAKSESETLEKAMKIIRDVTPGWGTYANEADYFEPDWQASFWGTNYPRLLEIKKKYDPENLFTCHHCVGSEFVTN